MALEKADLVLHEGAIYGHPLSDSIAIAGERILAHGSFGDLKPLIGPRTHVMRLEGRMVAPGFIDCHLHFLEAASAVTGLPLWRCRTVADLLTELRVAARKSPPGNWLRAFGCDESLMAERRGPTREELDEVVPRNPLRLRHQTLHASWLNSRAIAALGLEDPAFKSPPGALVERDQNGRLTGFVAAMEEWLGARLPIVTKAELEARARMFSRELAAAGVTTFTDATVRNRADDVALFAKLVAAGAISQRTTMMLGAEHIESMNQESIDQIRQAAKVSGIGLVGAKFMDVARMTAPQLARQVVAAIERGFDCCFHATQVEELEALLGAIESASARVREKALSACSFRIEHGGLIPPDYPERILAAGAWVVTNPGFIFYRGAKYASDPGLVPYLYRARSLAAAGIKLAAGTDAPVTPAKPLPAIAAAVLRLALEGYELAPEEQLASAQAFSLFTDAAARLTRLEAGEIAPGRLADLIVLPSDPLELEPAQLASLAVDLTIVGGRVIYERGRPLTANTAGSSLFSS